MAWVGHRSLATCGNFIKIVDLCQVWNEEVAVNLSRVRYYEHGEQVFLPGFKYYTLNRFAYSRRVSHLFTATVAKNIVHLSGVPHDTSSLRGPALV